MRGLALSRLLCGAALVAGAVGLSTAGYGASSKCDKLTGRDKSRCQFEERRASRNQQDQTQAPTKPAGTNSTSSNGGSTTVSSNGWKRIDVPSPRGFTLYDQLNSSDSRLYSSKEWADGMDTVSKAPRKTLACLLVVYAMVEHARGNSAFKAGPSTYTDKAGALGISGIGPQRSIGSMETIRSEFLAGRPVILWGPLTRNPSDPFGHFILAIGVGSDGKIIAHDPYGGRRVSIDPVTRAVSGSSAISTVEKYRTVSM